MVDHPVSHNVSVYRATQDTRRCVLLRLRDSHPLRPTFPDPSASSFRSLCKSCNPRHRSIWFGLFRFRSPLLAESSLLLVLLRCFSSDGSPSYTIGMTAFEHRRVSPFGYLRLSRSYTPHRRFSQYNTSFIGTRCLGIHCVPSDRFPYYRTESPALLARALRYYLRVDYSVLKTHSLPHPPTAHCLVGYHSVRQSTTSQHMMQDPNRKRNGEMFRNVAEWITPRT